MTNFLGDDSREREGWLGDTLTLNHPETVDQVQRRVSWCGQVTGKELTRRSEHPTKTASEHQLLGGDSRLLNKSQGL